MSPSVLFGRLLAKARLRHLHLLVRIAELESLQKAAASIHMSQPGATHALAELEGILEMSLFERHARGMRPTPICSALLPMARGALSHLERATQAMVALQSGATGHIRIAGIAAAMSSLMARVLPSFTQLHPEVSIDATPASASDLLRLMETREADILVCREPAAVPSHLTFLALEPDRYVVAAGRNHPLARNACASLSDLSSAHWLLPPPFGIAGQEFENLREVLGMAPSASWVTTKSILLTFAMLDQREVLALIPRNAIVQFLDAGLLVELACPDNITSPLAPIGLLLPRDAPKHSPAMDCFIDHACATYNAGKPAGAAVC